MLLNQSLKELKREFKNDVVVKGLLRSRKEVEKITDEEVSASTVQLDVTLEQYILKEILRKMRNNSIDSFDNCEVACNLTDKIIKEISPKHYLNRY